MDEVIIIHAKEDHNLAVIFEKMLNDVDIDGYIAENSIIPGKIIDDKLWRKIGEDVCILIVTKRYIEKLNNYTTYVSEEAVMIQRVGKRIYPLLEGSLFEGEEEAKNPFFDFKRIECVEFNEERPERGFNEMIDCLVKDKEIPPMDGMMIIAPRMNVMGEVLFFPFKVFTHINEWCASIVDEIKRMTR